MSTSTIVWRFILCLLWLKLCLSFPFLQLCGGCICVYCVLWGVGLVVVIAKRKENIVRLLLLPMIKKNMSMHNI